MVRLLPGDQHEHRIGKIDPSIQIEPADDCHSERTNAFVALIFGYSVLTILYQSRAKVSPPAQCDLPLTVTMLIGDIGGSECLSGEK